MEENLLPIPIPPTFSEQQVGGIINPPAVPTPTSLVPPLMPPAVSYGGGGGGQQQESPTAGIFDTINDYLGNQKNFNKKWAPYTKVGAYDADYTGTNFDRYYNVPDVYDKVGFSPFRNNEQIYNNNMSWWDGFKRSSGQSLTMASVSFKGALPWNAWDGEYSDIEGARRVERAAAIGNDSRGGFGGWVNNTMMNFGFTYGVLAEIAAEELALFGLSFIPGMQGVAATRTGFNMKRLGRLIQNIGTVGRAVNASAKIASSLRDISTIRDLYQTMKAAKVPRIFMPQTLEAVKDIYKGVRSGDALYSLANASKAFGGFYRDVREIQLAMSESKIEAGMVELNVKQKLTDSYYSREGKMPGYEESEKIDMYAKDAAKETFLWNMPVIYFSNKLVLDKALRGFMPTRVLRNQLSKGMYGKLQFNDLWYKTGGDPVKIVQQSIADKAKLLFKPRMWNAKNLTKDFLGGILLYSKANIAEGVQELFQESVAPAMESYYTNKYNNPHVWASKSKWGEFYKEGQKLVGSTQGLEIFASGFVMGGMAQLPQKLVFEYIPEKFMALTNKDEYKNYTNARKENTKRVVEALNYIIRSNPNKYFDATTQNAAAQANIDNDAYMANQNNDKLTYHDVLDEAVGEHIYTLLQTGKIDFLKDSLVGLSQMQTQEFIDAFGPTEASETDAGVHYRNRINKFQKEIEKIEKKYQYVQETHVNPFDEKMVDLTKDPDLYFELQSNRVSYERFKKLAVLSGYHYERTLERMASIYRKWLSTPEMSNMNSTDLSLLFSVNPKYVKSDASQIVPGIGTGSLVDEILNLKNQVKTLEQVKVTTPEGKKELSEKKKQLELLEKFEKLVNTQYLITLKDYKKAKANNDEEAIARHEEALESIVRRMKDVYTDYLLFVAEKSNLDTNDLLTKLPDGTKILNPNLDDAFMELKDFYTLSSDKSDLVQVINILHNPDIMMAGVRAGAKVVEIERQQFQTNAAAWWEKFLEHTDGNAILDELSKAGIFFDPAYLDDFKNGRLEKINFYFHTGKEFVNVNNLQEPMLSNARNAIETVLDKYAMMVTLSGRPTFEFRPEGGFTYGTRGKMKTDQRTLADLAIEYGFNTGTAETQIPAKTVLQKIIDGEYSTPSEKMLARELIKLIPEVINVRFRTDQPLPGSFGETTGILVDPRYSSKEYAKGTNPIEVVILQQTAKYVLNDALNKDTAFKAKVTDMLTAARQFQAKNRTEYSTMIGLKDELEFVSNALSNPNFQTMLSQVEYQVTGKSLWQEFMEAIKQFISTVFKKVPKEGTVLEEAMYIITAKLGTGPISGAAPATTAKTTMQKVGTSRYRIDSNLVFYENQDGTLRPIDNPEQKSPIDVIKDDIEARRQTDLNTDELYQAEIDSLTAKPGPAPSVRTPLTHLSPINDLKPIWEKLINAYKASEERREKDGYSPLTMGWRNMQDNEILNSDGFRKFLDTKPALEMIDEYNVAEGLVPKTVGGAGVRDKAPTMEQREKLKQLGWTPEQIAKLSFLAAADAIARNVSGTEEEDREATLRELERQRMENVKNDFYDSFNAIDPQAEGARAQLFEWLASVKEKDRLEDYLVLGINSTLWERMFNEKLAQLPKIDALEIGKIYKIDGVLYKVKESKDLVYYLERFDELAMPEEQRSEPLAIPKDQLNKMNITSAEMAEAPVEVGKEESNAIENNEQGLSAEEKEQAQKNASSNPDDIGFNPC